MRTKMDKLNKIRWIFAVAFFISCVGWIVLVQVHPDFDRANFYEEEAIYGAEKKILIDEYFDESINETVSVYRIIGYPDKVGLCWNMTNRIPDSRFVCSFGFADHTVVKNHELYINYRRGDIICVRENLTEEEEKEGD